MRTLHDMVIALGSKGKTYLTPPNFERHLTGLDYAEVGHDFKLTAFYLDGTSESVDGVGDWLDGFQEDECPGAIEICALVQRDRL